MQKRGMWEVNRVSQPPLGEQSLQAEADQRHRIHPPACLIEKKQGGVLCEYPSFNIK